MDTTLQRIEHKLTVVQGILHHAALEAESLTDQGLADDLHALHGDILMRLLPSVRRGRSRPALGDDRTYLYSPENHDRTPAP
jgi:hypothetical protein